MGSPQPSELSMRSTKTLLPLSRAPAVCGRVSTDDAKITGMTPPALTRITLVGALYLILISFIPEWMIAGIRLNHLWGPIGGFFEHLPSWVTNGLGVNFYFGGTSLLIVVGVAMDTINQVESQLVMRHYEGFTPRSGRIRGRRATW